MSEMRRVPFYLAVILLILSSVPVIETAKGGEDPTIDEGTSTPNDQGIPSPMISPIIGNLTDHEPLIINNETDLKSQVSKEVWSGSGTENDPYVIKDLDIDAEGDDSAICFSNITSHILIFNCKVHNSSLYYPGYLEGLVHIEDSSNLTFSNCEIRGGIYGFRLFERCQSISVRNSTFSDHYIGIHNDYSRISDRCEEIEVFNCTFKGLNSHGILLCRCSQISIVGSYFEVDDDGIYLKNGSDIKVLNSEFYDCDDAIYMREIDGIVISSGEYDLCDVAIRTYYCSSISIDDIEADRIDSKEIILYHAVDVKISGITSKSGYYDDGGVKLDYVENCTVDDFDIRGVYSEFYISRSRDICIKDGFIEHDDHQRNIRMVYSSNSTFKNITLGGIKSTGCENITVEDCDLHTVSQASLELYESSFMMFRDNRIENSDHVFSVRSDFETINCTYFNNQFTGGLIDIDYSTSRNDYRALRSQIIPPNNTLNGQPIRQFIGVDLGNDPVPEGSQYFFIDSSNISFRNTEINDGFHSPFLGCRHLTFEDVELWYTSLGGLSIMNSTDVFIANATVMDHPQHGIKIEGCVDVSVKHSILENGSYYDLKVAETTDLEVVGCEIEEISSLNYVTNGVLINNTIKESTYIVNSEYITLSENEAREIRVSGSNDVQMWKNRFRYYSYGVKITDSMDISLLSNEFVHLSDTIRGYGVYLSSSNRILVDDSVFNKNDCGVYSFDSDNLTVAGTRIENGTWGIFSAYGNDHIYQDNTVMYCENGIQMIDSTGYIITSNIIKRCENYAIEFNQDSNENWIHGNAFIENNRATGSDYNYNSAQILDLSGDNRFDHLGKGNHYSEHTTPDADFDGIVDVEYVFQGVNNSDPFPLVRTPLPTFDAPEITHILPGDSIIGLIWSKPDVRIGKPIEGYRVYMKKGEGEFQIVYEGSLSQKIALRNLENGVAHLFMVSAFNDVGEGLLSTPVSGIPDGTGPEITFMSPSEGEFVSRELVMIEFEVTDNESGVESMNISIDGGLPISLEVRRMGYKILSLDEGPHTVKLSSKNSIGLVSEAWLNFTIDRTSPRIVLQEPDLIYTNEDSFTLHYETLPDISGLEDLYMFHLDGDRIDETRKESFTIPLPEDGEYQLAITRSDVAGNNGYRGFTIIKDTEKPEIQVSPVDGSIFKRSEIEIIWEMSGTGSPVVDLEISINRNLISTDPEGPFIWFAPEDGNYLVSFFIMDAAGNINSTDMTYTVDTKAPVIKSIYPIGPDIPLDANFRLSFDDELKYARIWLDGVPISTLVNYKTAYNTEDLDLHPGTLYMVRVEAEDLAGNIFKGNDFSFTAVDWGRATGRVVNTDGNPIKVASMEISGKMFPCDENGVFEVYLPGMEGTFPIIIKSDGYEDHEVNVTFELGEVDSLGDIVMIPVEEDNGSVALAAIIFLILILSLICIAMIILVVVKKRRRGIDEGDMAILKEIMSGFGIRRSPREINCYSVLGVGRRASQREIRKAYRDLASQYHPDRNINRKEAKEMEEKIREINAAKTILMDPEKREVHDRMLDTFWG